MKYTSNPPFLKRQSFIKYLQKDQNPPDPVDSWVSCFTKAYPSTILFPNVEGKMTIKSLD